MYFISSVFNDSLKLLLLMQITLIHGESNINAGVNINETDEKEQNSTSSVECESIGSVWIGEQSNINPMGSAVDLICNAYTTKSINFNWTINGTYVSPFTGDILSLKLKSRRLSDVGKYNLLVQGLLRLHRLKYNASYICTVYDESCSRSTEPIQLYVTESNVDVKMNDKTLSTVESGDEYILPMISSIFIFLLAATLAVVWHSFRR